IKPKEELLKKVKLSSKKVYSQKLLQEDLRTIRSDYADQGYAYARVEPDIKEHKEANLVDIDYQITKNKLVYFERISIVGNDKSRDKVIRRELKVVEGGLFSAEDLRQSAMNLRRLQYFQNADIIPSQGSEDDKMNLKVEVKEQPTGAFSVGAGYSSFNQVFGMVRVSQNNFRGTGQKLSVQATLGGRTTEYDLSFTEPWLFDIPLSAGFDIFRQTVEYDEFDKKSIGFSLRASYPIWEYLRVSGRYMLENIEVTDISDAASPLIKEIAGESVTSLITFVLMRDTRDRFFNPTQGSVNSLTIDYAGGLLGGTNSFTRYVANSGWYIPTFWEGFTFFVRGRAGYAMEGEDGRFPAYEKFYLGGINSLRGFKWATVTPRDPVTNEKLGGEKMVLFNLEFIFPVIKEAGFMGVVFFDQGNVWSKDQDYNLGDLRRSYGIGIRYYSPFGPLRLEWGQVIDPRAGEPTSNLEFSVGTFF
ncbi:MAG: outer membrane protein assembly factor BamA, partial [Pseudomonadota bacterium]